MNNINHKICELENVSLAVVKYLNNLEQETEKSRSKSKQRHDYKTLLKYQKKIKKMSKSEI